MGYATSQSEPAQCAGRMIGFGFGNWSRKARETFFKTVTKQSRKDLMIHARPEDYMLLPSDKEHVLLTKLVNYVDYHGLLMA